MKKIYLAALLALAGAGFTTQSAQAALTYNAGDLFIGFRNSGGSVTQDYLIDVGSASLYTQNNGSTFNLNSIPNPIGGTAADLSSIFTSTWFTGGLTRWGVIGAEYSPDPTSTLYAGKPESSFGTFPVGFGSNTSYRRGTTDNQTGTLSNEQTMRLEYQNFGTATSNSSVATFQSTGDSSGWFATVQSPAFGQFSGFEGLITNSGTGNNGHALDLFRIVPDDSTPGTLAPAYQGRFVIDNTGTINYTSVTPEPSTLTALAGGVGLLGFLLRRRAVTA